MASALERKGYSVSIHPDSISARDHIVSGCQGCVVGFGDSRTLEAMGLNDALSASCTVIDPARTTDNDSFLEVARRAMSADVFVTSANAMSEDGVIVNIDGTGNRIAGSLFGHRRMIYVVSRNKIVPDLDSAIDRARNVAAPMNAKSFFIVPLKSAAFSPGIMPRGPCPIGPRRGGRWSVVSYPISFPLSWRDEMEHAARPLEKSSKAGRHIRRFLDDFSMRAVVSRREVMACRGWEGA